MSSQATHPVRMLVIDERPEVRRSIASVLAGTDVTVYDIGSPLGATSIITRLRVDVVVIGARTSVMAGSRFAQLVRNNPRLRHVKVVLLLPELPAQVERSREFEQVDAVLAESDVGEALVRTVNRLVRRPFAGARSAPVLLVDPEPARREHVRRTIAELGREVHAVAHGAKALAAALEVRPRVIVLAENIYDVDPAELVERMRRDRVTRTARIYLLGDARTADLEHLGAACGANGVIHADIGRADLRERLSADSEAA